MSARRGGKSRSSAPKPPKKKNLNGFTCGVGVPVFCVYFQRGNQVV